MSAKVELTGGGEGEAVRFERDQLHVVLPRAFAPGAPIAFRATLGGAEVDLTGKSLGSKRREDGRFDVRLRMTNLRREHRALLVALA